MEEDKRKDVDSRMISALLKTLEEQGKLIDEKNEAIRQRDERIAKLEKDIDDYEEMVRYPY